MRKARLLFISIVVLVALAVALYGVKYFFFPQQIVSQSNVLNAADYIASQAPLEHPRTPPPGFKEYHNRTYHFSLFYPEDLSIAEYAEGSGGHTVSFQNQEGKGFQIYVVPYLKREITKEQFILDEPSGVIEQKTDVLIDGVRSTMFFGENNIMGKTREVWFIRGGYIYEVTTYKELDTWLGQIMQSWEFI